MAHTIAEPQLTLFDAAPATTTARTEYIALPTEDNTTEGLQALLALNAQFHTKVWPAPFDTTRHTLHLGDARELSWIASESVHLVVTSPPYWNLKQYAEHNAQQMGDIADYE